jgi:hypothetical protein
MGTSGSGSSVLDSSSSSLGNGYRVFCPGLHITPRIDVDSSIVMAQVCTFKCLTPIEMLEQPNL